MNYLDGYKTYIGALGFGLIALYHLYLGQHDRAAEDALAALGLLGLRGAVAKVEEASK